MTEHEYDEHEYDDRDYWQEEPDEDPRIAEEEDRLNGPDPSGSMADAAARRYEQSLWDLLP